jgi:hypothetical protein
VTVISSAPSKSIGMLHMKVHIGDSNDAQRASHCVVSFPGWGHDSPVNRSAGSDAHPGQHREKLVPDGAGPAGACHASLRNVTCRSYFVHLVEDAASQLATQVWTGPPLPIPCSEI